MTALRRPIALAVAALLAAAVATFALTRDGDGPPAVRAARLVPATALAYVHLSTDRRRGSVERASELLRRFPTVRGTGESLTAPLTAIGPGLSYGRDVHPWLGREAALALLGTPTETAVPVAVLEVADRARADAFLDRSSAPPEIGGYRSVRIATYGQLATAFLGDHLVAGPDAGVRSAIDVWAGGKPSLARSAGFRRATAGMSGDRVLDAYLPAEGVRRLLVAQPGPLSAAGDLLVQPGLTAVAVSVGPSEQGLALRVRKLAARTGATRQPAFAPRLARAVPADALAYLGFAGFDRRAATILGGLAGDAAPLVSAVLARVASEVRRSGVDVERELGPVFRGEVAVWLRRARSAPTLTLIAGAPDEAAARRALERLRRPVEAALRAPGAAARGAPRFEEVDVAGVRAQRLRLGPGVEVAAAVFDGKLVASTSLEGIRAMRRPSGSLAGSPGFESTLGRHPRRVTSLVFLDFGHLLRLGEGSGVSAGPAYRVLGADLRKLRAVGAATTAQPGGSTTEIAIQIPEP